MAAVLTTVDQTKKKRRTKSVGQGAGQRGGAKKAVERKKGESGG